MSSLAGDGSTKRHFSRQEERAAMLDMHPGLTFDVEWGFGANEVWDDGPVITMRGTVISREKDGDGSPIVLIRYEPHAEALPSGGVLEFPPLSVGYPPRPVWIYRLTRVDMPAS